MPRSQHVGRVLMGKGRKHHGAKRKSKRQVRFLLSKGSPLSAEQKSKLKGELHTGAVKVKKH